MFLRLKLLREQCNRDFRFKTLAGSWASLCLTLIFAAYHGFLGLNLSSLWHGSICVYYLLLMFIRGIVLLTNHAAGTKNPDTQRLWRQRAFSASSAMLIVLNFALIVPVSLMVRMEKPVNMGLTPAIAIAAYTTCKITLAIANMRRSGAHPLLIRELRTINLIDALVAILTLQNTLIMVNSTAGEETGMITLTAVSSGLIYLAIMILTIQLFLKQKQSLQAAKPVGFALH